MKNRGFTLVEILVVMAILAIVGTILVAIFTNTLRGSNKSQILGVIKQNGQAVLESMDKIIKSADNIVCVTDTYPTAIPPAGRTLVVVKNGVYTRFRFIEKENCVNGNGCIQQDNPPPDPTKNIQEFLNSANGICADSDPLKPDSVVTLTDTNSKSGVSVISGSFSKSKQAGFKDSVTITFTLTPGAGIPVAISDQIDPVLFQTTVLLR